MDITGDFFLEVQREVARLSFNGPPCFPPPPPPPASPDCRSPVPQDGDPEPMYEVPPALEDEKQPGSVATDGKSASVSSGDASINQDPATTAAGVDEWTPGYDVISNPKSKAKDASGEPASGPKPVPRKKPQQSETENHSEESKGRPARSSLVIERPPHLYQVVSDELLDGSADPGQPKTVAVPMRHMHIYEAPDEALKPRPKSKLPPKNRPPLDPPKKESPVTPDSNHHGNGNTDHNSITAAVSPSVTPSKLTSDPSASLHGAGVPVKRLMVDIQYPERVEEGGRAGRGGGGGGKAVEEEEPVFLFPKNRCSNFIKVGVSE